MDILRDLIECILENCDSVPGVSLEKGPDSSELFLDSEAGRGQMVFYTLFPGLTTAFVDVSATVWQEADSNSELKPLLINYCISGRSELLLDDGSYIYLKENDFCISNQTAQKEYIFPTGQYQGIKIYLDVPQLLNSSRGLLEAFSINLPRLENIYCDESKTYINQADHELGGICRRLWKRPAAFYLKSYTLELLYLVLNMEVRSSGSSGSYTRTQVEIAKKAAFILSSDLRMHIPIRQIARRFSVSETSLKNYFRGVYGQNVSEWLREIRMKEAARLLSEGRLSIAEISELVGYSNQGKFAAVFRKQYRLSPLEYRRVRNLENK